MDSSRQVADWQAVARARVELVVGNLPGKACRRGKQVAPDAVWPLPLAHFRRTGTRVHGSGIGTARALALFRARTARGTHRSSWRECMTRNSSPLPLHGPRGTAGSRSE